MERHSFLHLDTTSAESVPKRKGYRWDTTDTTLADADIITESYFTKTTGQAAFCITSTATLPIKKSFEPVRDLVPIIMMFTL